MVPTKAKNLIPEVAIKLNIPEDHLDNMVSFYYKENKKLLSELKHLHILLKGLGRMTIKGWLLKESIEKFDSLILLSKKDEIVKHAKLNKVRYEEIEKKWIDQEKRKKEMRILKKDYYNKKQDTHETKRKDSSSLE